MTDAEFHNIREKCDSLITLWKERLWLHPWKIDTIYQREPSEHSALMSISPDWRYMSATLYVHAWDIRNAELDDEDTEKAVIHELCHCLLDELNTCVPDEHETWHDNHVERTVSMLTNVLYAAYPKSTTTVENW